MQERNYYSIFLNYIDKPLTDFFKDLLQKDWVALFNDYYRGEETWLCRIFQIPKGETLHSYVLIYFEGLSGHLIDLITSANNELFLTYYRDNEALLLNELLNSVSFLNLPIDQILISDFILDKTFRNQLREKAAYTLISVHENSLNSFWENLDLKTEVFLLPSYLAFYSNKDPIQGFRKLKLIKEQPSDLSKFETPILYSLNQIAGSPSDIEKLRKLQLELPKWAAELIDIIFDEYPELSPLKNKLSNPEDKLLIDMGLSTNVFQDESIPIHMRMSLLKLVNKVNDNPSLREVIKDEDLTIIDPTYIKDLNPLFKKLKNKIRSLKIGEINNPKNNEVFEATEKKSYYRIPTLFLYPYFLDDTRIDELNAGVIQYGTQTTMAMVINKSNDRYDDWCELRIKTELSLKQEVPDRNFNDSEIDRNIPEKDSILWLISLIKEIYENSGSIETIRGYVFTSIIQEFAERNISNNKKLGEVIKFPTDINSVLAANSPLPFYRTLGPSERVDVNQILLIDPADALGVSQNGHRIFQTSKLNEEYDIIYVKHGLEIRVGIGYSIFALPRLLKDHNYKIIQDFMFEHLTEESKEYKETLEAVLNKVCINILPYEKSLYPNYLPI